MVPPCGLILLLCVVCPLLVVGLEQQLINCQVFYVERGPSTASQNHSGAPGLHTALYYCLDGAVVAR